MKFLFVQAAGLGPSRWERSWCSGHDAPKLQNPRWSRLLDRYAFPNSPEDLLERVIKVNVLVRVA